MTFELACDMKCLKDKLSKLENFVCDLKIFSGRLLKVIETLFRTLLSLRALRM